MPWKFRLVWDSKLEPHSQSNTERRCSYDNSSEESGENQTTGRVHGHVRRRYRTTWTAVQTGLTGNSNFQNLPVDLAVLKTDIESLSALIAESLDGSKKVIAQKNKQREAVIKMLLLLGRFVEVHCNGDMAIFTASGFVPASTAKVPPAPLPLPVIRSVDHGVISGEIVVQVEAIPKAVHYEIRSVGADGG